MSIWKVISCMIFKIDGKLIGFMSACVIWGICSTFLFLSGFSGMLMSPEGLFKKIIKLKQVWNWLCNLFLETVGFRNHNPRVITYCIMSKKEKKRQMLTMTDRQKNTFHWMHRNSSQLDVWIRAGSPLSMFCNIPRGWSHLQGSFQQIWSSVYSLMVFMSAQLWGEFSIQ